MKKGGQLCEAEAGCGWSREAATLRGGLTGSSCRKTARTRSNSNGPREKLRQPFQGARKKVVWDKSRLFPAPSNLSDTACALTEGDLETSELRMSGRWSAWLHRFRTREGHLSFLLLSKPCDWSVAEQPAFYSRGPVRPASGAGRNERCGNGLRGKKPEGPGRRSDVRPDARNRRTAWS